MSTFKVGDAVKYTNMWTVKDLLTNKECILDISVVNLNWWEKYKDKIFTIKAFRDELYYSVIMECNGEDAAVHPSWIAIVPKDKTFYSRKLLKEGCVL